MKNPKCGFSRLLRFACFLAFPAFSAAQLPDARLRGTLTDPSGAGIPDARVTVEREDSPAGKPQSADSSADGSYALDLVAGRYHIVVSKTAFLTRDAEITLASGETGTLNFRLELAPM